MSNLNKAVFRLLFKTGLEDLLGQLINENSNLREYYPIVMDVFKEMADEFKEKLN